MLLLVAAVYVQAVPLDDVPEEVMEDDLAIIAARALVADEDELERGFFGAGYHPSYIYRPRPPRPSRPSRKQAGAIYNSNYNRNSNKITDVSSLFSSIFDQLISSQYQQKPSRPIYRPPYYPYFPYMGRPRSDEDVADPEVTSDSTSQEASVSEWFRGIAQRPISVLLYCYTQTSNTCLAYSNLDQGYVKTYSSQS